MAITFLCLLTRTIKTNEAFQANYVKGDMELEDRGKCPV